MDDEISAYLSRVVRDSRNEWRSQTPEGDRLAKEHRRSTRSGCASAANASRPRPTRRNEGGTLERGRPLFPYPTDAFMPQGL